MLQRIKSLHSQWLIAFGKIWNFISWFEGWKWFSYFLAYIVFVCFYMSNNHFSLYPKPILGLRSNTNSFEIAESASIMKQMFNFIDYTKWQNRILCKFFDCVDSANTRNVTQNWSWSIQYRIIPYQFQSKITIPINKWLW